MLTKPRQLTQDDDLSGFECGVDSIDSWVRKHAARAKTAGTAVVYATFDERTLAGFYTLSAQSIPRANASSWLSRNTPESVPLILLGMLGVDKRYQGIGLGRDLLLDAVKRSIEISSLIGAKALLVEPIDEHATSFYEKYGFTKLGSGKYLYAKL